MLNRRSWWDRCIFCLGMKLLAVSHSMKIVVVRVQRFTPRQGKNAKHNLLKKHFSSARKHFSFMNGWTGPWRQYFTCSVNGLLCPDVGRTHRTCPAEPGTDLTFFLGKRQSGGERNDVNGKKKKFAKGKLNSPKPPCHEMSSAWQMEGLGEGASCQGCAGRIPHSP